MTERDKLVEERHRLYGVMQKCRHGRVQIPPEELSELQEAEARIKEIDAQLEAEHNVT